MTLLDLQNQIASIAMKYSSAQIPLIMGDYEVDIKLEDVFNNEECYIETKIKPLDVSIASIAPSDFIVYMHKRYNQTKEDFCRSINEDCDFCRGTPQTYQYEEYTLSARKANVDYNDLYVGARLWMDVSGLNATSYEFEEIEITHLHAGVIFYKILTGNNASDLEHHMDVGSINAIASLYPKIVYKPANMKIACNCPKVKFLNY